MNKGTFIDALSMIDPELVCSAEKYEEKRGAPALKTSALIVAPILAVAVIAAAAAAVSTAVIKRNALPGAPDFGSMTQVIENQVPLADFTDDNPEYVQPFSTPTIEELYSDPVFEWLLPRKLPDGIVCYRSYLTEERGFLGLYLYSEPWEQWKQRAVDPSGADDWNSCFQLEIKISQFTNGTLLADLADPNTYRLSLYYGPMEKDPSVLGSQLPRVFGAVYAEDLSREIIEDKIYTFSEGGCTAVISVVCGDRVVKIRYYGKEISADDFCNLVSSSWYVVKGLRTCTIDLK
ncbi:MAG: hypothetical protein IKX86_02760 [Clostridia bacterium]|nr:hypothetical protein [Clostridia bacterium]